MAAFWGASFAAGYAARGRNVTRSGSPVEEARAGLIERLAALDPHRILYIADARDLEESAEHLQQVLGAVLDHIGAVVADTAENCSAL